MMINVHQSMQKSLLIKLSAGFVLGIIFGFAVAPLIPDSAMLKNNVMPVIDLIGKLFLFLLTLIIIPLVFSSLIAGTASIRDIKTLGRIGVKTLFLFFLTTLIALFLGLTVANFFNIGMTPVEQVHAVPFREFFPDIFHNNIIEPFVRDNMLYVIVIAFAVGLVCIILGEAGKKISNFFGGIADIMHWLTQILMKFAPYGVFALISVTSARFGMAILAPFAKLIFVIYLGCFIHAVLIYSGLIIFFCKHSPLWFFNGIHDALITAFVTRSSSGTLPVTFQSAGNNLGISEKICSFVLPLGATINMDGTALYLGVCSIFVANSFGIPLTFQMQLGIFASATLASIGAAGVQGAGLIMLTTVLTSVGLPIEGVALVAGIDVVLSSARTCLNVAGDIAVCASVAASEK